MQAFLYRHLTPSRQLVVAVIGKRSAPPITLRDPSPVRIPLGGTAQVLIETPRRPELHKLQFELSEPPEGVTLERVSVVSDGLTLKLKADANTAKTGLVDNLIVEAFTENAGRRPGRQGAKRKRRFSLGVLPAIPFEIVQR